MQGCALRLRLCLKAQGKKEQANSLEVTYGEEADAAAVAETTSGEDSEEDAEED